ncbi:hypothetical protein EV186_102492 [Labedaea rhizosphaerae]|uniref:Uncharacterized protein n=2 Tax=Labedaea rhizosphaerae TaxID=598644 RepID=A0A4V3CZQ4_LABRH|nr:hypothetical protein EV186_102492 [Labedaea rhizosphaerae]
MNRLGRVAQTLNPLTYLAVAFLVVVATLAASLTSVHTGLTSCLAPDALTAGPSAFAMLSAYLQWFWHNASTLALLGLRIQP